MLPNFIVIGAMKAGTTSLASYLAAHPEVFVTVPKEPRYFARYWDQGQAWYESLYAEAGDAVARGEATTEYTKLPQVPGVADRIAGAVPHARIIYLVRNPVDRIRSHYMHRACATSARPERAPFEEVVRSKPPYLDWTRYAYQLRPYLEHFARDQVLVVSSESLRDDRAATLATIFEFIGVDPVAEIATIGEELNVGAGRKRLVRGTRIFRGALRRSGLPLRYQEIVVRWLHRQDVSADVSAELEAWIWSELDDDLQELRTIVGPDFDLWGRVP